ncbi:MAG TPA: type VI secretion system protein TssA [Pirellulaceae bacterium]|nr:type VI secretion system protein TssA [Pirellulaceae bacterium]
MFVVDIDKLLRSISEDAPCGENLEYDASFIKMEQAAQPKPSQEFGDTVVPGEEPDWRTVKTLATELLDQSRDLRVLLNLTRAVLHTDGLPAFHSCLQGFTRLITERWPSVHPQLDPDDDDDPTLRVNLVAALNDDDTTLKYLHSAELVKSRSVGRFSMRDFDVASGDLKPVATDDEDAKAPPSLEMINAAFTECDVNELQANAAACKGALESAVALESALTTQVGVSQAASLVELRRLLQRMNAVYAGQLTRRGVGVVDDDDDDDDDAPGATANGAGNVVVQKVSGEINSREDVIRAIDKICEYYARFEPSSPLPLLLRRAKRLANKSFLEIVRDLSPDALKQVLALGGEDDNGSGKPVSSASVDDDDD